MGLFSAQHEPAVQFGTVCPVSRYNYAIAFKEKNFLGGGEGGGGGGGGGGIKDEFKMLFHC